MKKLQTAIIALLITAGGMFQLHASLPSTSRIQSNYNQTQKTPEERATSRTQMLTKRLGLNANQQKQVYSICLQHAQQNMAARANSQGDKNAIRNARKQNEEAMEKNLTSVLTTDQKEKFEQMKQEQMEKRQQRGK